MQTISIPRTIAGGVLGTLAMTAVGLYAAPFMGIPAMNPADMLAGQMGGSIALGWAGHLMIGVVLALIYGMAVASRLTGSPALRGALYSIAPWLLAQVAVMPMMGMGLFSSSGSMAIGSLFGHLVYGVVLGAVAGIPAESIAHTGRAASTASAAQ